MTNAATDRSDYPLHRLAETLLDLLPLAESEARRRGEAIVDGAGAVSVRDIQAVMLHEALAFWQVETRGQDLTAEYVTEILDDLRDTLTLNAPVIAASLAGGREQAYLDVLRDLHGPSDDDGS